MEDKTKWGILGTANIAKKALIPGILAAQNCELHAIAGRKKEKIEEFKELFNPSRTYSSYDELLDDDQVQAVYIPLPNALHLEWTIKALEKGKNVLCEKPIALDELEAKRMFGVASDKKKVLMEAFAYIHNPLIKKVKEIADSGKIGELKAIDCNFTFDLTSRIDDIRWSKHLSGGAMYDLGCYTLHFSRFIAGSEPSQIHSMIKRTKDGVDEETTVLMRFENDIHCTFHVSFVQPFDQLCRIQGTKGTIITPLTFNEKGTLKYYIQAGRDCSEFTVESPDNYMLEATHFANVLQGKERPIISREDSIQNAYFIKKILEADSTARTQIQMTQL